jgi:hypothetical protein
LGFQELDRLAAFLLEVGGAGWEREFDLDAERLGGLVAVDKLGEAGEGVRCLVFGCSELSV